MSQIELIRKFQFGSNLPLEVFLPGTVEYDLTIGTRQRERQLVHLAKAQLAESREQSKNLSLNFSSLASEIRHQTKRLEQSIERGLAGLSDQLYQFQDMVHVELSAIRWELTEHNRLMREVLDFLSKPLDTVALNHVRQGRTHLERGVYDRSIQSFLSALEQDRTCYEAYMSLGFSYLHTENLAPAIAAFAEAVRYAPGKTALPRAEALLALGRCYFCSKDWGKAISACEQILRDPKSIPKALAARSHYLLAIYLSKAERIPEALKSLCSAIESSEDYISVAASDKDWDGHIDEIRSFLDSLVSESATQAVGIIDELLGHAQATTRYSPSELSDRNLHDKMLRLVDYLGKCRETLRFEPSYSLARELISVGPTLSKLMRGWAGWQTTTAESDRIEARGRELTGCRREIEVQLEKKFGSQRKWIPFKVLLVTLSPAGLSLALAGLVALLFALLNTRSGSYVGRFYVSGFRVDDYEELIFKWLMVVGFFGPPVLVLAHRWIARRLESRVDRAERLSKAFREKTQIDQELLRLRAELAANKMKMMTPEEASLEQSLATIQAHLPNAFPSARGEEPENPARKLGRG